MTQAQSLHQSMTQTAAYDGQPAKLVTLTNQHGMEVTLMDIGATWLSCILPLKGNKRSIIGCQLNGKLQQTSQLYGHHSRSLR